MNHCLIFICCLLAACATPGISQDILFEEITTRDGTELTLGLMLPDNYDSKKIYPVALAFPPGPQTRDMVNAGFSGYWGESLAKKGWIIASPVAPKDQLFFTGAEKHLGDILVHLRVTFRIEGLKIHLLGASNGGRSALRAAALRPWEFASLTVLPGFGTPEDEARYSALKNIPVRMFVGGDDTKWVQHAERTVDLLRKAGADVSLRVFPGEGHTPQSLDDTLVVETVSALRAGLPRPEETIRDIADTLDRFHEAAARADEDTYFGLFAPEGVFLGTEGTERWNVEEFRKWSDAYFKRRSAWIFVPSRRSIHRHGDLAWFDEAATSAPYGECRGSGVLRLMDGQWRVAQYNLSFVIPNDVASDAVALIRRFESGLPLEPTVVWICRHAEKGVDTGDGNPSLSDAGIKRAENLKSILQGVPISAVYTTQYKRTQETAASLAAALNLKSEVYDPRRSDQMAPRILRENAGRQVLVVGHSNTVPELLKSLGIQEKIEIPEDEFGTLYVVFRDALGKSSFHRLKF